MIRNTQKFPFNFLAASPAPPSAFRNGKEIFRVAAREVTNAPRGAVQYHHAPQCVRGSIKPPRAPRVAIILFQNSFERR